jgi:hypothetical protein
LGDTVSSDSVVLTDREDIAMFRESFWTVGMGAFALILCSACRKWFGLGVADTLWLVTLVVAVSSVALGLRLKEDEVTVVGAILLVILSNMVGSALMSDAKFTPFLLVLGCNTLAFAIVREEFTSWSWRMAYLGVVLVPALLNGVGFSLAVEGRWFSLVDSSALGVFVVSTTISLVSAGTLAFVTYVKERRAETRTRTL